MPPKPRASDRPDRRLPADRSTRVVPPTERDDVITFVWRTRAGIQPVVLTVRHPLH